MALPVLSKTWQYNVNQAITAAGSVTATGQAIFLAIKNTLKGFGTLPWTVRGSSDSVAAGMDAVDRWVAAGNLVGGNPAVAHSWIVLRQTGIATNYELCIDLTDVGFSSQTIVISPSAAFTGGSTTDRPTATDEIVLINGGACWSNLDANHVIHGWQSTDGQCTRLVVWRASTNLCTFLMFDKPATSVTGWTNPSLGAWQAAGAGVPNLYSTLGHATASPFKGRGSTTMTLAFTGEGAYSSGTYMSQTTDIGTNPNDFDSNWPLFPIGLFSTTAAHRGRHGTVSDLWWKPQSVGNAGDTFPNDATRLFVAFGDLIFPWNGSVPVVA